VDLLKEIPLPVRVGFIAAGEPSDDVTVYGACLHVKLVLCAPIDRNPILPPSD
jgi:hypothetical protein